MKKNLFTLLMVFGCVGLFAACSSSSKDEVVEIDSPLVGAWNLNEAGSVIFNWEAIEGVSDKEFALKIPEIPNLMEAQDYEVSSLVEMVKMILPGVLKTKIKTINFLENGNITAHYFDGADNSWKDSPEGLATYKVLSKNKLSVQLHAKAIIEEAGIKDEQSIAAMTKYMIEPFVVNYDLGKDDNELDCFVDKAFVTKYMKELLPVLQSGVISEDAKPIVEDLLGQLKGLFEQTEKFELGLSLERAK